MTVNHKLLPHQLAYARKESRKILEELDGIKAVVLATVDGFDITSAVREDTDPTRVAAMASSISAISSAVSQEAHLGRSKSVIINTDSGFSVVTNVYCNQEEYIINVIADERAILAQVNYRTAQFALALVENQ